jgi:cytochrome c
MKKLALATIVAAVVTPAAFANPALAEKKNCLACHQVDKKLVGPSYKEVAAKYTGQKDAAAKLAEKIQKGGTGVWGQVPMPANPQVNADEAKTLATWILTVK